MSEQLLPCPFCGGEDLLQSPVEGITCRTCHTQVIGCGVDEDVTVWNRRAARSHESERVKGLEEVALNTVTLCEAMENDSACPVPGWYGQIGALAEAARSALSAIPGEAVLAGEGNSSAQSQPCGAREPISRAAPEAEPSASSGVVPTTCIETIGGDPDTALRLSFQIKVF